MSCVQTVAAPYRGPVGHLALRRRLGRWAPEINFRMPKKRRSFSPQANTAIPAANVRISDVVRPFSGDGDVVQWICKLEMVAKLRGTTELSNFLPLFLEGPAFDVYSEMEESSKKDDEKIKKALIDAFGTNAFQAYELLAKRSWNGEPVDVYLSDLRRLAKLADVESEALLRRAFIVGLPPAVSRELRAVAKIDQMNLASILERARALMAEQVVGATAAVAAQRRQPQRTSSQPNQPRRQCYRCGGPHLVRSCKSPVTCWTCGADGHRSSECAGNERGETSAPGAFP